MTETQIINIMNEYIKLQPDIIDLLESIEENFRESGHCTITDDSMLGVRIKTILNKIYSEINSKVIPGSN